MRATRGRTDDARSDGVARNDSYYASAYNAPRASEGGSDARRGDARARWGLRGFVPPAHLRVDGYAYDGAEDSASGSARRKMFVAPRTIEEHEVMFVNDGMGGDADEREHGVAVTREDALARRVTGNMSSRPSWTAMHACGDIAV